MQIQFGIWLRAFRDAPRDAGVRADCVMPCPAIKRDAVLLVETDSISVIGGTGL
jgi:hypothetical protein